MNAQLPVRARGNSIGGTGSRHAGRHSLDRLLRRFRTGSALAAICRRANSARCRGGGGTRVGHGGRSRRGQVLGSILLAGVLQSAAAEGFDEAVEIEPFVQRLSARHPVDAERTRDILRRAVVQQRVLDAITRRRRPSPGAITGRFFSGPSGRSGASDSGGNTARSWKGQSGSSGFRHRSWSRSSVSRPSTEAGPAP